MILILTTSLFLQYTDFFLIIFIAGEILTLVLFLKMDISFCTQELKDVNVQLNPIFIEERRYLESNNLKIKYYKVFTIYLICYWSMEVAVLSLRPFLALYHEWIFVLVQQILTLISMSFLFITLTYSIEFENFEGVKDGAIIAPNPYIIGRVPKICGEIIVVKTVCERGFPEHSIGVECYNSHTAYSPDKLYINQRAKAYQSSSNTQNDMTLDMKNSKCNVLGGRHNSGKIDLENLSSNSYENEKEFEYKEETKQFNFSSIMKKESDLQ
mmetsp:Transcript_2623/g.2215  ORF Transcript_2623/g.2215 Transcript_2623/m.2215 type:complete len:269 (+) Transcript_2623:1012-1818(+)